MKKKKGIYYVEFDGEILLFAFTGEEVVREGVSLQMIGSLLECGIDELYHTNG